MSWVSAAVGCACAAGLPLLAVFVTAAHFLIVYGYPPLTRFLTRSRPATSVVRVSYRDGEGALRRILELATTSGYSVEQAGTERRSDEEEGRDGTIVRVRPVIDLRMRLVGPPGVTELLTALSEQPGVLSVDTGDIDSASE